MDPMGMKLWDFSLTANQNLITTQRKSPGLNVGRLSLKKLEFSRGNPNPKLDIFIYMNSKFDLKYIYNMDIDIDIWQKEVVPLFPKDRLNSLDYF